MSWSYYTPNCRLPRPSMDNPTALQEFERQAMCRPRDGHVPGERDRRPAFSEGQSGMSNAIRRAWLSSSIFVGDNVPTY